MENLNRFEIWYRNQAQEELKYMRIVNPVIRMISAGELHQGDRLPSINEMCRITGFSRDTVLTAFARLEELGFIKPLHGKGFFVSCTANPPLIPIFLFFDVMNGYKEVLYRSFVESLGPQYQVDIYFHYYNLEVFEKLIMEKNGKYDHYVIMPHFNTDIASPLSVLPADKVLLIDNIVPSLGNKLPAVYQNFEKDIFNALMDGIELLKKYRKLYFIKNTRFQFIPDGMVKGFVKFCKETDIPYELISVARAVPFRKGNAYIAVSDNDLIDLIRLAIDNRFKPGYDIGLISYDETPLKEVLAGGITVISTDFKAMGVLAASMIKERKIGQIENRCYFIKRNTL